MTVDDCPRCGDLLRTLADYFGEYRYCIMCGYHKDIIHEIVIPASMKGRRKPGRRPNRIVEIDKFLSTDRQARQIIKKEVI